MDLSDATKSIPTYVEMSRVIGITINDLIDKGASLRSYVLFLKYCKEHNYLVPVNQCKKEIYQGATVIDPITGLHQWVSCGDFNSLYPSIMIHINGCPSSFIPQENLNKYEKDDYNLFEVKIYDKEGEYLFTKKHAFIKKEKHQGILPLIEIDLLSSRAETRKEIEELKKLKENYLDELKLCKEDEINITKLNNLIEKINVDLDILDKRQLAKKIAANSLYGWIAASSNSTACVPVSETITFIGRYLIGESKDYIEKNFNKKKGYDFDTLIVYGDSVTGDTPILCRDRETENIFYRTIDQIGNDFININGKEYSTCNLDVWTDEGFTKIKRVIKHKTNKKMYRILTHTGCVDVTEDHSLLDLNAEKIKPSQLKKGDDLLHKNLPINEKETELSEKEAWVWGFFYADGYCDFDVGRNNDKSSWKISKLNKNLLEKAKEYLEEIYENTDQEFEIVDERKSSKVYNLKAKKKIKQISIKYRKLFYDYNKLKKVPDIILNSKFEIRKSFFEGYYSGDGDKSSNNTRFDNKGKIGSAGLYYIANSIGYNVSINTRQDKPNIFRMTCTKIKQSKDPNKIKKIHSIENTDEYVYDLETENHHFSAGIGRMIVHNTDSVMIKQIYSEEVDVQKVIKDSKMIVKEVTKYLQENSKSTILKMGWEKVYGWMLLCGKKKYSGLKYEDDKPPKIDTKGLDNVRRETTKMTKDLINKMFEIIFKERDIKKAEDLVKQTISDLLQQKIRISDLISSKKLKSEDLYVNPDNQIHVVLNNKIKERGGNPYRPGDRVLFVVLSGENFKSKSHKISNTKITEKSKRITPNSNSVSRKSLVSERGEDPLYAEENDLKLDIDYYFENQIQKPLKRIFECVINNFDSLFKGEHTRKKVLVTPNIFALSKFVKEIETCLCCKEKLKKSNDMEDLYNGPLCKTCESKGLLITKYKELKNSKDEISNKQNECLEKCYKCQGSRNEIICSNYNACITFWDKRDNIKKEKKIDKLLSKFFKN